MGMRHPSMLIEPHRSLWAAAILLAVIDFAWGMEGHWVFKMRSLEIALAVVFCLLLPLASGRYRADDRMRTALLCSSGFILFSLPASFFDYLTVTTNEPLIDKTLAAWDHMLGFDWPAVYLWIKQRPQLNLAFAIAYASVLFQISVVIIYLAFTRRKTQLAEFNVALILTYLITSVISVYCPAAGPAKYYQAVVHADVSMLSHFEPLRNGILRFFDLRVAQGLVSIPSFHAIMAILLTYAMRRTRIFPAFLALNLLVIASTPTQGEHYLVDLIAGAITAAAVIVFLKKFTSFSSVRRKHRLEGVDCHSPSSAKTAL